MTKEMLLDDIECLIRKQLVNEGRSYEVACIIAEKVRKDAAKHPAEYIKEFRDWLLK